MTEKFLQTKNIHVSYKGVKALDGVSVYLDEGEIVSLMGPNGAGKSTILKVIFGIAQIESGEILLHEKQIKPISHELVKLGISFVPQGKRVFNNLTVKENIEIGGFSLQDKKLIKERLDDVLNLFPFLKQRLNQKGGLLSGGQQQMVAIARGLMIDPKAILLDEPSLGLSPKVTKEVFEKIKEINQSRKTVVMIVEHNLKSILPISDRVYVLDKGKVVYEGTEKEIVGSGILQKVFLGKI